jgi:hypothetical protein
MLASPAAAGAATPRAFFGVSAVDPVGSDFERMGTGAVGTYRFLLPWSSVQSAQGGGYNWTAPDFEIAGAASNGMRPFPFVYGTPRFAGATAETPPLGSAAARREWKRFLTAAVTRYGPHGELWELNPSLPYRPVRAWQIGNEPNATFFWDGKPSPRKYATLLRLSSKAIKEVDRRAQIVLGGMYGFPNGRASIYLRDFLKRLYRVRSIRRRFDGVAIHPYGASMRLTRYQIEAARRIMDRNGDDAVPIWITEIGWATDGPAGWQQVTSEAGQAKKLRQAFRMLRGNRHRWGIKRVIWFVWRDFEEKACKWCGSAGLIARNGDPKPAWPAFVSFTGRR